MIVKYVEVLEFLKMYISCMKLRFICINQSIDLKVQKFKILLKF